MCVPSSTPDAGDVYHVDGLDVGDVHHVEGPERTYLHPPKALSVDSLTGCVLHKWVAEECLKICRAENDSCFPRRWRRQLDASLREKCVDVQSCAPHLAGQGGAREAFWTLPAPSRYLHAIHRAHEQARDRAINLSLDFLTRSKPGPQSEGGYSLKKPC